MSVLGLARPDIRALEPYSSARMEAGAAAVLLNANESPWPPTDDGGLGLNRYPDPQPAALVDALAAQFGVGRDQILVGRGSDEAIDLLTRAFCRAGEDAVVVMPPTFGMYAVCARIQGARVLEVPLDEDFAVDATALEAVAAQGVKLVYVCSPNNPSGGLVPRELITRWATALAGRALLVVDEAYIEFAGAPSCADLLGRHENLAILRTLSKAWSLAGARIGVLMASPEIVALLRRIMPPYPLPTPSIRAALATLSPAGRTRMAEQVAAIVRERDRVAGRLQATPGVTRVLPSRANFIAFRHRDAARAYAHLAAHDVLLRDIGRYRGLAGCLRLSIGLPEHNERALALLAGLAEAT